MQEHMEETTDEGSSALSRRGPMLIELVMD